VQLTLATWNMDYWKRLHFGGDPDHLTKAWRYALSLGADLLLVQEAVSPPTSVRTAAMECIPSADRPELWWIGRTRRWGSALVKLNPAIETAQIATIPLGAPRPREQLAISHPGTFVLAEIRVDGTEPLVVASVYGMMDGFNPELADSYSTTTVNRMLSDLTPLLDSKRGRRVVLGGDLNSGGDQWSPATPLGARLGPMHAVTYERFAALGLTDAVRLKVPAGRSPLAGCPCGPRDDCRHVRTFRGGNKADGPPYQNDYFFVGRELVDAVRDCHPLDEEAAWALSDHCPVVLTLDL
jgi:exonuclease III